MSLAASSAISCLSVSVLHVVVEEESGNVGWGVAFNYSVAGRVSTWLNCLAAYKSIAHAGVIRVYPCNAL
jgi:hypothetical protein